VLSNKNIEDFNIADPDINRILERFYSSMKETKGRKGKR